MIQIPEHILLLIEKQLKGNPDSAETATLLQWRNEREAHERVYRQLEKIWQETGTILQQPTYDAESAWDKVDSRLRQGKSNHTVRMMTRLAMAASIAGILFFAGWMLFNKKEPTMQLANADAANKTLTLPDGSQVVLRKGATLSYPETFSGNQREVSLTGEAYFDVQHDAAHPFRIQTSRATLEVLGTSFTINTSNQQDELVVSTGKVLFSNKAANGEKHIILPNQYSKLDAKGFEIKPVNDPNFLSWKTGKLQFDNTPIDQVATTLSNHYNVFIKADSGLMKLPVVPTITAKFEQQSIDGVLEEIKLLVNISHRKQNDTIFLFKP
jgi:ferric-dicitrate binding protein FerR (iron transport regulator)